MVKHITLYSFTFELLSDLQNPIHFFCYFCAFCTNHYKYRYTSRDGQYSFTSMDKTIKVTKMFTKTLFNFIYPKAGGWHFVTQLELKHLPPHKSNGGEFQACGVFLRITLFKSSQQFDVSSLFGCMADCYSMLPDHVLNITDLRWQTFFFQLHLPFSFLN